MNTTLYVYNEIGDSAISTVIAQELRDAKTRKF